MCFCRADIILCRQIDEDLVAAISDMMLAYDKILTDAWVRESDRATTNGISAFAEERTNEAGYSAMLAVLSQDLVDILTPAEVERVTVLVDGVYRALKEAGALDVGTSYGISQLDSGAIRGLSGEGPYWIGDFYNTHLSRRIADVGHRVAVEGGFGRVAAGRTMRDALREHFALSGGTTFDSAIPAKFSGNVNNYTQIVSANVAQRARVYSAISAFGDAGIRRYMFTAQLDERTSEICQEMNGKIFTVASATRIIEQAANADTPAIFRDLHPWPKNAESIRAIAGTGTVSEQSARLEDAGIVMPPLHDRCRSTVEAID